MMTVDWLSAVFFLGGEGAPERRIGYDIGRTV